MFIILKLTQLIWSQYINVTEGQTGVDHKLIIRVINFELVQPICPRYINVTDRQTDGRTTYDSDTALALRASRGKN